MPNGYGGNKERLAKLRKWPSQRRDLKQTYASRGGLPASAQSMIKVNANPLRHPAAAASALSLPVSRARHIRSRRLRIGLQLYPLLDRLRHVWRQVRCWPLNRSESGDCCSETLARILRLATCHCWHSDYRPGWRRRLRSFSAARLAGRGSKTRYPRLPIRSSRPG